MAAQAFEGACIAMHTAMHDRGKAILRRATEGEGESK
jgi:hypothetical protein